MSRSVLTLLFATLFTLLSAGAARAETNVLTFEGLPSSYYGYSAQSVGSYYADQPLGPTFAGTNAVILSSDYNLNTSGYPPHSGKAVLNESFGTSVELDFTTGGASFVGFFYRTSTNLTLTAYDESNYTVATAVTTDTTTSPNPEGFLSVNSAQANIRKIVLAGSSGSYTIDDITYQVQATPSLNLIGTGGNYLPPNGDTVTVPPGGSTTLNFTLLNSGGAALDGVQVSFTGTNPEDLSVGTAPATQIAGGGKTAFTVIVTPATTATRTAVMHIASNDPSVPSYDVTLQYASGPSITSPTTAFAQVNQYFTYQITASNDPYSYYASGLPYGLYYSSYSGTISGTPYYTGTYSVYLYAYGYPSVSGTLTLTVGTLTPTITSDTNETATQGQPYSYQIVATNSPTSYHAIGLPDGLALDAASGLISGTPTSYGYFYPQFTATNEHGEGPTFYFYLYITPVVPVIDPDQFVTAKVRESVDYQISVTNSPTSITADGLPPGLTVDSATGRITGKGTKSGLYDVVLTATNSHGSTTETLEIGIVAPLADDFAKRVTIAGKSISLYVTTEGATEEAGEPLHANTYGNGSLWCTWKALATGQYLIAQDTDALIAVYQGATLATLKEVISNADLGSGRQQESISWRWPGRTIRSPWTALWITAPSPPQI